jgi:hypothetical protein
MFHEKIISIKVKRHRKFEEKSKKFVFMACNTAVGNLLFKFHYGAVGKV